MGCSLSHAMALASWLFADSTENCLVLEDDFATHSREQFEGVLDTAIQSRLSWDVFLLASNVAVPIENTPIENVYRVINAQTTSAYLVTRRYAPRLISQFFASAELYRAHRHVPSLAEPNLQAVFFALDSLWKNLQLNDRFWAALPQVCFQRASYSDVQLRFTNYGV